MHTELSGGVGRGGGKRGGGGGGGVGSYIMHGHWCILPEMLGQSLGTVKKNNTMINKHIIICGPYRDTEGRGCMEYL